MTPTQKPNSGGSRLSSLPFRPGRQAGKPATTNKFLPCSDVGSHERDGFSTVLPMGCVRFSPLVCLISRRERVVRSQRDFKAAWARIAPERYKHREAIDQPQAA